MFNSFKSGKNKWLHKKGTEISKYPEMIYFKSSGISRKKLTMIQKNKSYLL